MSALWIRVNLVVACCLLAPLAVAEDWTQYRGPQGDGKSSESIVENGKLREVWKVPTELGFSSFVVAGGRAFTQVLIDGDESLLALDADTGKTQWTTKLGPNDWRGGGDAGARDNNGGDGPRSTPATDGQRVYTYDAHMVLSCFAAADGELIWKHDIIDEYEGRNIKWHNASSPVLDGDRIYVGGGGAGQSFLAFEKSTGKQLWTAGDEKVTHATPVVTTIDGKKQVIFFAESGLVSIDPSNGQELWRRKFNFSVSTAASPVVEGDLVYCSAGYGVGAGLFKINESPEVERVWLKPNKLMNHWSTPVVHDGHLYGIFEFKKYGRAPLNCVELETGEIKWSQRGFGPGNCILVGGKLVVLSDAGELVFADATPDGYHETSRTDVLDGKCWSTPAFSDGRIYIRSTVEGACLELDAS